MTPKHALFPDLHSIVRFVGSDPTYEAVRAMVEHFKSRDPPSSLVTNVPYQVQVHNEPFFTPSRLPTYSLDAEAFIKKEIEQLLQDDKIEYKLIKFKSI